MVAEINGIASGLINTRFLASGNIAINTNWFTDDITPFSDARKRFSLDDSFTVVKHTLQIMVPATTVVNIILKLGAVTKSLALNSGINLTLGVGYQFDILLAAGMTYNIQHETGTQNVSVIITESFNSDI